MAAQFDALDLSPPILKTIEKQGYSEPTEIQSEAIPHLMQGKDLIGIAQTGGGKTAAFTIPLLEKLSAENMRPSPRKPRAVILAPTRELANQISETVKLFCRGLRLYQTVIYGGAPFRPQMNALNRGVDILVATPGRLLDHIERGNVKFDECTTFILDEADRMLDMGFIDDVRKIALMLDSNHQTIMFSATMSPPIRRLANEILKKPVSVEIAKEITVAETIDHRLLFVAKNNKRALLKKILNEDDIKRVLIFTRTKADADHLVTFLEASDFKTAAIHGDKAQRVRERTLLSFKRGKFDILVATDVAARGIDVKDITHVINFSLPLEAENYVHRVGRTGRAGQTGVAISFCDAGERALLKEIERFIQMSVRLDKDHPYHLEIHDKKAIAGAKHRKGNNFRKGGAKGKNGNNFFKATKKAGAGKPKSPFVTRRQSKAGPSKSSGSNTGNQPLMRKTG